MALNNGPETLSQFNITVLFEHDQQAMEFCRVQLNYIATRANNGSISKCRVIREGHHPCDSELITIISFGMLCLSISGGGGGGDCGSCSVCAMQERY